MFNGIQPLVMLLGQAFVRLPHARTALLEYWLAMEWAPKSVSQLPELSVQLLDSREVEVVSQYQREEHEPHSQSVQTPIQFRPWQEL